MGASSSALRVDASGADPTGEVFWCVLCVFMCAVCAVCAVRNVCAVGCGLLSLTLAHASLRAGCRWRMDGTKSRRRSWWRRCGRCSQPPPASPTTSCGLPSPGSCLRTVRTSRCRRCAASFFLVVFAACLPCSRPSFPLFAHLPSLLLPHTHHSGQSLCGCLGRSRRRSKTLRSSCSWCRTSRRGTRRP